MKKPDIIWSQFPVKNQVAHQVAYSSVFNDVISVEEVKKRLAFNSSKEIDKSIDDLVRAGSVVKRKGFLAIPHLDFKIDEKGNDFKTSDRTFQRAAKYLELMGKLPFVKFVGISGSVAAKNPTQTDDKPLDIDVFVIVSDSFTWFIGIFMAIYRVFATKFRAPVFCFNHIWSERDLLVYNQNLFSAVEVWNLTPITGKKHYHFFLEENRWVESYFPSLFQFDVGREEYQSSPNSISSINKWFYLVFILFRCLKHFNLDDLRNFSYELDPGNQFNLSRRGSQNGGYQLLVQQRFEKNMKEYLWPFYDEHLVNHFFDDALSRSIRRGNYDINTLSKEKAQLSDLALNYAKYQD